MSSSFILHSSCSIFQGIFLGLILLLLILLIGSFGMCGGKMNQWMNKSRVHTQSKCTTSTSINLQLFILLLLLLFFTFTKFLFCISHYSDHSYCSIMFNPLLSSVVWIRCCYRILSQLRKQTQGGYTLYLHQGSAGPEFKLGILTPMPL